ncbi:hypothetical protein TNCV_4059311 [Trichonephila clavipes]|nr:hypothetical protein TNCV_4059311 [Trichonephila clavipes]
MLQENVSNLLSYQRRLERLAGILKFQELLKMYPVPVKVVKNENGFHITDCVWTTLSNHVVPNSFAQSSSGCYGDGKIYFRLVALLGHVFTKRFDTLVIQGQKCVAGSIQS